LSESEKFKKEQQIKVKQLQKSCPPKTIKQLRNACERTANYEKATKEQKSSSTEQ
jgi:hypothetical protein